MLKKLINNPELFFLLMIFALPFTEFPIFEIGFTLLMSYVFALLAFVSFVTKEAREHRLKIIDMPLKLPLFLFLCIVGLSVFQSHFIPPGAKYFIHINVEILIHRHWMRSITQFFALLFMAAPFYLTINFIKTKEMLYRVIYVWLFANTIICLYGLYGFIGHYLRFPFADFATMAGFGPFMVRRIKSVGLEPLFLGISIMAILPLGICLALVKKKKRLFFAIGVQLLTLVLTFSRGAWFAFIASLVIISFGFRKNFFKNIKIIAVFILSVFVLLEGLFYLLFHSSLAVYFTKRILYSFSGTTDYSNLVRFDTWITAWRMFKAHPILGVGIGNFWFHYYDYSPLIMYDFWISTKGIPPTVNNIFLSFLAETGILGIATLIAFLFVLFKMVFKSILIAKDAEWRLILFGNLACLVALLVGCQFFSTFYFLYIWVLFGMTVAICKLADKDLIVKKKIYNA